MLSKSVVVVVLFSFHVRWLNCGKATGKLGYIIVSANNIPMKIVSILTGCMMESVIGKKPHEE
jgi:hypothetical protein